MKQKMISARVELDEYSNRVMAVVKAKYGLRDKSDAINKFVELYGDEIVEKEASDAYLKKVIELADKHIKKHDKRKMSLKELDSLTN